MYVAGCDEGSGSISLWDARTGDFLKRFDAHTDPIRCLTSNVFDCGLVSCSEDSRVKYWNVDFK